MDPVRFRPKPPLVADASVWINLVAGGRAADVLRALVKPTIIPSIALGELERGRERGHSAYAGITPLIADGYVTVVDLPEAAEDIYLCLVAGRASQTLDDGEAATLAIALHLGATALIDERKAIGIAAARFPDLTVATTTDLLLSAHVRSVLDADTLAAALFASLTQARMRVPDHLLDEVCACLGPDRARLCLSLPARIRTGLTDIAAAPLIRDLA
jgi:predicted nucleic acid-binding protein